jgi:hypothetical protein
VLGQLQDWGATQVDWTSDVSENVVFPVPKPLRRTG